MFEIKWAYASYSKDGLRFHLSQNGMLYVSANGIDLTEFSQFKFQDTGNPWIPKYKNFKSIITMMVDEGDFDEFYKKLEAKKQKEKQCRYFSVDLYDAVSCGDFGKASEIAKKIKEKIKK